MILRRASFFSLALGCALLLLGTSTVEAQFTLTIDTVNDTYAFSGTDTGAGETTTLGSAVVVFEGTNPAIDIFFDQDFTSSFSVDGSSGVSAANLGVRDSLATGGDGSAELRLQFDDLGVQTLTANGAEVSFASQSESNRLGLEALVGTTLNLVEGTGFSPISVVAAPMVPVLKGDVDMDGDVDFSDIAPFITVLQDGTDQAEADCDCSGDVDFSDIPVFIAILQMQ